MFRCSYISTRTYDHTFLPHQQSPDRIATMDRFDETCAAVFVSSDDSDFALFLNSRMRWLQEQLAHLQKMKLQAQQKQQLQKQQPQVQFLNCSPELIKLETILMIISLQNNIVRRRSDQHCHQVSWAITLAEREFERRKRLQRRRAAWAIPTSDGSARPLSRAANSSRMRAGLVRAH